MMPATPEDRASDFDELLAEFDESTAHAADVDLKKTLTEDLSIESRRRLEEAKQCVEMLDRVRRRSDAPTTEELDSALEDEDFDEEFEHPKVLGKFHIQRLLGRGGLSLVYLAVDPDLDRLVALKVPRPEVLLTGSLRRRFVREAEAASRLEHENIVRVLEAGQDGLVCYIASEYCAGGTLAGWIEQCKEPVSLEASAEIVRNLADAAQHAHRRGILHRDIKPSNVMVDEPTADQSGPSSGAGLRVRLTDFGMAKLLESGDSETRTGDIIGTPAYMSPEQASGRNDDVDVRSDVYSLGTILYELLTGRPCYRGAGDADTLRRILTDDPPAPRQLRRDVPRDLEAICLKCLAREPNLRYSTADALANDLTRYLKSEPTVARPLHGWDRALKWARRHPARAALLGVVTLSLVVVFLTVAGYNARLVHALQSKDRAQQNEAAARMAAEDARYKAEQQAVRMRRMLYAADMKVAFEALQHGELRLASQRLTQYAPKNDTEDLRTFLWHYLKRRCEGEAQLLAGHRDSVYCAEFSPDGQHIASAGADGDIILWNANDGRRVATLASNGFEVNGLDYSLDGQWLAAVGDGATIRVWSVVDVENNLHEAIPNTIHVEGDRAIYSVAFSPDGRLLASGGQDNRVHLWNTTDWSSGGKLVEHEDHIESLAFSPDGSRLATGSTDRTVKLWDVQSRSVLHTLDAHRKEKSRVSRVVFSHDGMRLVSCGLHDEQALVWDTQTGDLLAALEGHQDWVQGASFSADDALIATACKNGIVRLWDSSSYTEVARVVGHHGRVWNATFSPHAQRLATAGADGRVLIWNIDEIFRRRIELHYESPVISMTIVPHSSGVAIQEHAGDVHEVEVTTGDSIRRLDVSQAYLHEGLDYSTHERLVVARYGPEKLGLWETNDWQLVREIASDRNDTTCTRFSAAGDLLAIAGHNRRVRLLDVETGEEIASLVDDAGSLLCLAFSPDDRHLAVAGETNRVRIWNLETLDVDVDVDRFARRINALVFSPEGNLIVFGGDDRVVFVYDRATLQVHRLLGHNEKILDIAFSPDGLTFASCSEDGDVRLWDRRAMQEVATFSDHPGRTDFVGFSSDGNALIAAGSYLDHETQGAVEGPQEAGFVFIYSARHQ